MQEPIRNGSLKKPIENSDLADGITDGRELLDWRSKYAEPDARREIKFEAIYLALLLLIIPIAIVTLWLGYPKRWLNLSDERYKPLLKYGLAWFGGVLGGILFALKWLYRSVARQGWHLDRRLWRLFTPHISGGLAFAVITLISSGIIRVFDRQATESLSLVISVSFMVGYFSDSAIAKLTEIAETLFGASRPKEEHKEASRSTVNSSIKNESTTNSPGSLEEEKRFSYIKASQLEDAKTEDAETNTN